jgi:hypothetical protein
VLDDPLHKAPRALSRVNLPLPQRRMDEAVAQAMAFARAVVIARLKMGSNCRKGSNLRGALQVSPAE